MVALQELAMIDLHVPPHKLNLPTLEGLKCGKTSDLRLDTLNKSRQCTIQHIRRTHLVRVSNMVRCTLYCSEICQKSTFEDTLN
jgi:hypothetical protein